MSTTTRSFWSTIPGLVTGLAGILTALVGLGALLVSLGVIGDKDSGSPSTQSPAAKSSGTSGATSGSGATDGSAEKVSFTVNRSDLALTAVKTTDVITVTNQGNVALAVNKPELSGDDADKFTVDATDCTATRVPVNGSCVLEVTYKGGLDASAVVAVSADDTSETAKITLTGSLA